MVGRVIKKLTGLLYQHPKIPEDVPQPGKFGQLKVALIADHFTTECLSVECRIRQVTPDNYQEVIQLWQPDLLFVESVFHGAEGSWRYELAKQPKYLRLTKPRAIFEVIDFARAQNIPTVFWNKDDGAFFDDFIDVAKVFDYIFTTDRECIQRYRAQVPDHIPVNTLIMPYQPAFHNFTGFHFTQNEACFTGSYYRRILNERRRFLDMVFDVCGETDLQLNIFDRNCDRFSRYFEFRFPEKTHLHLHSKVPHRETAQIYKTYALSLNVNSVTSSETMCSRRLLEILACGGIAVTNTSRAVDRYFRDYCHVVTTQEEARELFARLRHGPSQEDKDRAEAGAHYVRQNHTWSHRLEEIANVVKV